MSLITKEEYMSNINVIAKKIGVKWEDVEFTKEHLELGIIAEMKQSEALAIKTKEQAAEAALAHLKADPKYYNKSDQIAESTILSSVLLKIENKTVSIDDFNQLIKEATPASVVDRVRRKMNPNNKRKRRKHDASGHAPGLPKLAARINPARKRPNRTQMQHGGKQGHRRSTRTQRRNSQKSKIAEAILFFRTHMGKVIDDQQLVKLENRQMLKKVATKLMSKPNANRDWLCDFMNKVDNG